MPHLESEGYSIIAAPSGEIALQIVDRTKPDLILNAIQIIDYPHAPGHLWECAKKAEGFHNETKVARWVKTTENYLFSGNIEPVDKRILKLQQVNPSFRDEFSNQLIIFASMPIGCNTVIFARKVTKLVAELLKAHVNEKSDYFVNRWWLLM